MLSLARNEGAAEQLAGDVNATGNDVFESADVGKESQRLQVAQAAFRERIAALRKDLLATAPSQQGPALVGELDALGEGEVRLQRRGDFVHADAEADRHHRLR